jgi:UDP-3-O-[3-hydroxymyristoyl] glucosamine N-acyltransferase
MSYSLSQLARQLNASLMGDGQQQIHGLATLVQAGPGQLSFFTNPKYRQQLLATKAEAVIIDAANAEACPVAALVVANPYLALAQLSHLFAPVKQSIPGIADSAVVSPTAKIDETAYIGPNVVIEDQVIIAANVVIGANCTLGPGTKIGVGSRLYPQVTCYPQVTIGQRAVIQSGVILGADGFGFASDGGQWHKIAQLGGVVIGDDVEIGANTTIDCGTIEDTLIGNGVKLDNQVQIAHNVTIGDHTIIAGCAGVAGSTDVGKHCLIGGATAINGHLQIADRVVIAGMAMVTKSIREPGHYASGVACSSATKWRKNAVRFYHLDEMAKRLKFVEQQLAALKKNYP